MTRELPSNYVPDSEFWKLRVRDEEARKERYRTENPDPLASLLRDVLRTPPKGPKVISFDVKRP